MPHFCLQKNMQPFGTSGSGEYKLLLLTHTDTDVPSCRGSQGFILVYSIASRTSFNRLNIFHDSIRRVQVTCSHPIFVLVGNQVDKTSDREVLTEEGAALARRFGCDFIETSAKTAHNVDALFIDLVCRLRQTRNISSLSASPEKEEHSICSRCIIF